MKYIKIDSEDMSNGPGLRVVLWVSGCIHRCKGCHNSSTWDYSKGEIYRKSTISYIRSLLDKDYIDGITYSGGDPMFVYNRGKIRNTILKIKKHLPNKTQWLYTGYTFEELVSYDIPVITEILENIDVLVDGKFDINLKDSSLLYRGSSNQRIINVQKSLKENKIVLW